MKIRSLVTVLLFLLTSRTFASQTLLLSHYSQYMQNYNPAYTGQLPLQLSFLGGYGGYGYGAPANFAFRSMSGQNIGGYQPFWHSNYVNMNFSSQIKLENEPKIGFGLSYMNNDVDYLETANTSAASLSYIGYVKGGRIQFGVSAKSNMKYIASKRIYRVYTDKTYTIEKLQQTRGNMDIGVMYSTDSNTFQAGLALNNVLREHYSQNTTDNLYQLYSNRMAQIIATISNKTSLSEKVKWVNSGVLVMNSDFSKPDFIVKSTIGSRPWNGGILVQRQFGFLMYGLTGSHVSSHFDVFLSFKTGYYNGTLNRLTELGLLVK